MEIPRKGRPNTWGVRTPLHLNKATGQKERYWIGREFKNKTEAERASRKWMTDHDAGKLAARSDMKLGDWLDKWLSNHRKEGTTLAGYETKIRLHIKPHIGGVKLCEVTDDTLDDLYRLLESAPCPTNWGKPLGAKSVRHIHNILSGALGAAVPKLIPTNPAATAHPPTARQIKAQESKFPTLDDDQTRRFLSAVWEPCGGRRCGPLHHCLRDAALWTTIAVTGVRRSEAMGMRWSLINWDQGVIELGWVVVEVGNTFLLRRLPKDGDDNARIYVDQSVMNVLKRQRERQNVERARLGDAWVDSDLVFARDGFKLYRGEAGGPQDPEKVSARWRTLRNRLHLPENFRLHDWRHSKVTNDLEAGENPVEVSANVRHHSPGYTMARYGHTRKDGARRLAASGAGRLGLSSLV
ncbi:tyrosine-type recombinase/integrase [Streptomyces albipurpureus]|uniref:Site-specific integrase n=1 Tax=Streptomyces albipurpureus TaxID=2897419 RepID=A0ABT0UQR1_9ACTN|nr:tyrosine-type recombinase/integrase [Streptomyces sp. CWNU-1]MCM2390339.1 site-specific integrase [Streptomyces sp. CWNU-1]